VTCSPTSPPKTRRPPSAPPAPLHRPALLCVDEVGYLSYDSRYADLLFEVVTRRYDTQKPVLLSTNKAFADWGEVFPHAACVVTLVDRLVHRAEVIEIEAESYRLKEAKELTRRPHQAAPRKKHLICASPVNFTGIARSRPRQHGRLPITSGP
jgi:phage tail protein X